jgi:hypothetical protein
MLTLPIDELTGEQLADDLDRFAKHLLTSRHRRPASADDVFVEIFSTAEAEGESAVGEDLQSCGFLRDDGGVVAHRRTGDVREQLDLFGRVGHSAEHRPRIGRMPL